MQEENGEDSREGSPFSEGICVEFLQVWGTFGRSLGSLNPWQGHRDLRLGNVALPGYSQAPNWDLRFWGGQDEVRNPHFPENEGFTSFFIGIRSPQ